MSMAINFFLQNYANTSAVLLNYDKLKLELTKLLAIVWFVWKSWRAWLTLALMIQLKKISLFSIYIFWWRKKKISKRIIAMWIYLCMKLQKNKNVATYFLYDTIYTCSPWNRDEHTIILISNALMSPYLQHFRVCENFEWLVLFIDMFFYNTCIKLWWLTFSEYIDSAIIIKISNETLKLCYWISRTLK